MLDEETFKEITELKEENLSLETLIRDGVDARQTISVELPDGRKGGAIIRPLSVSEWSNCSQKVLAMKGKSSMELNVCSKGLLTLKEEPFPVELLTKLPAGTVQEIFHKIREISGVKRDKEEEMELATKMLNLSN